MKTLTKIVTRIWFTLSCLMIFGLGWIALSKSDVQIEQPQVVNNNEFTVTSMNLAPVPSFNDLVGNSKLSASSSASSPAPQVRFSAPVIRTKGS